MKENLMHPDLFDKKADMSKEQQSDIIIKAFEKIIDNRPFVDRKKIDLKDTAVDHKLQIDSLRSELEGIGIDFGSGFSIFEIADLYNRSMTNLIEKTRRGVKAKLLNIDKKKQRDDAQGDLFKEIK
jgi:hypothetical protein